MVATRAGEVGRIVVASPQVADLAEELQPFRSKCAVIPYALDPDQHAITAELATRVETLRRERSEPGVAGVSSSTHPP